MRRIQIRINTDLDNNQDFRLKDRLTDYVHGEAKASVVHNYRNTLMDQGLGEEQAVNQAKLNYFNDYVTVESQQLTQSYSGHFQNRIQSLRNAAQSIINLYNLQANTEQLPIPDENDYKKSHSYIVTILVNRLGAAYAKEYSSGISTDELKKRFAKQLELADSMQGMIDTRPVELTVTAEYNKPGRYIIQEDSPMQLNHFIVRNLINLRDKGHNSWSPYLDKAEYDVIRHYLQHVLPQDPTHLQRLTIPSRLRTVVGLANHSQHRLLTLDQSGSNNELKVYPPATRSAHVAHRDYFKKNNLKPTTRYKWACQNIRDSLIRSIECMTAEEFLRKSQSGELAFFIQTFTGTLWGDDSKLYHDYNQAVNAFHNGVNNDKKVQQCLSNKMSRVNSQILASNPYDPSLLLQPPRIEVYATCHPFNYERYLTNSDEAKVTQTKLIEYYFKHYKPALMQSGKQPDDLTHNALIGLQQHKYYYKGHFPHLWQSALEILAAKEIGICLDFCVSGKDRTALQLMLADSLTLFARDHKNRLPKFLTNGTNEELVKFAVYFARLYCTEHHQGNTMFNTPGMVALKNMGSYMPDEFVRQIDVIRSKQSVENESRYAGINDVTKNYKPQLNTESEADLRQTGNQYSPGSQTQPQHQNAEGQGNVDQRLLDKLASIVNSDAYWKSRSMSGGGSNLPKGIGILKRIVNNGLEGGFSNQHILKEMVERARSQLQAGSYTPAKNLSFWLFGTARINNRHRDTQYVYELISEIDINNQDAKQRAIHDLEHFENVMNASQQHTMEPGYQQNRP